MCLVLSETDVAAVLTVERVHQLTREALAGYAAQTIVHPVRITAVNRDQAAVVAAMPAFSYERQVFATKLVAVFPQNSQRGLPSHQAHILLHGGGDGTLLAILDGRLITEMRTAAASAVATVALANPSAKQIAILGTGVQAWAHTRAMVSALGKVMFQIWGRNHERAEELADRVSSEFGIEATATQTIAEALRDVDVVVTATASPEPLIEYGEVRPGTHINAIGACTPRARELATSVVEHATIYVDSREAAVKEAGDLLIPFADHAGEHIRANIGEVLLGRDPGRASSGEITLFKSLGIAAEDLAVAAWVYEEARRRGMGRDLEI